MSETEVRMRPHGGLAAGIVAGVIGGLVLGLAEGLKATFGADGQIAAVPLALALCMPAAVLLGLFFGALRRAISSLLPTEDAGLWALCRRRKEVDEQLVAGVLAVGLCVLLQTALVAAFALGPAAGMARKVNGALSTGLAAGAGLVILALLFLPLWRGLLPLARRVPRLGGRPALTTTLVLLGLGLVAAVAFLLSRVDWRVIRFGPYVAILALGVGVGALTQWLAQRPLGRGSVIAALVVGLLLPLLAPALGSSSGAVTAAQQKGWSSPLWISLGRRLGDSDGDGFSAWFHGGDCDDTNPKIHPGAKDVPGNGIDENCMGGDARVRRRRPKAAASKPTAATGAPKVAKAKKAIAAGQNLLVVCIDTLRADVLGVAGHPDKLTPHLDALAKRGAYFPTAYAQGPNTPQSFPSIFTSRYPPRVPYVKRFTGYPRLKSEAVTMWEVLQKAGFETAAVSSHFYFTKRRGIRQGFASWDNRDATGIRDSNKDIAAPRIVPRAIKKLQGFAKRRQRFALFVHLFEPHSTYVLHKGKGYPYNKRGVAGLRQKYDNEVRFVDEWLGKLLAGLDKAGLKDNTVVALFSDHGEAFGEHRFYFHGQALYNEVLRVPLIITAPKLPPRRVAKPVALVDLAPTLLSLFGLEIPESFQGYSLLPWWTKEGSGGPPGDRAIGASLLRYPAWPKGQRAMIAGRYKVIRRITENRWEIYNLAEDPREKKNLARRDPALLGRLRAAYARFVEGELE